MNGTLDSRRVLFLGPPNSGKSTIFNRLTGASAHVGNYPGITVEQYAATLRTAQGVVQAVDLPGTFSLSARSPEEHVAMDCLIGLSGEVPSLVVMVVDAPRLARSLYLVLQVLELGVPVVVAVNLMDEARRIGREPQIEAISEALGVPCVPVVGSKGEGIEALRDAISAALADPQAVAPGGPVPDTEPRKLLLEPIIQALPAYLVDSVHGRPSAQLALADWLLMSLDDDHALRDMPDLPRDQVATVAREQLDEGRDLQVELVARRYRWIDARENIFLTVVPVDSPDISERLDRWLLHPAIGVPSFLMLMALIFTALFSWADPFISFIESVFAYAGVGTALAFEVTAGWLPGAAGPIGLLGEFVVNGLIGGVGAVVVFVPQIAILTMLIAVLEDSGYLARAAYLMDRILRMAGLPGQAFVPLLSGFACAVPAIQATRTLPRYRDRLLTMMVLPLTSCSARLPVYSLLIASLFPATMIAYVIPLQPAILFGMYLFSTVLTVIAALVLGNTLVRDRATPTIIELP
ncbi:MAG: ferrous iron transport protein B, partial [Kiritimatiellia bacterium]